MENWGRFFFTTITNSNEYLSQQQCVTAEKFRRTQKLPTSRNNNNTKEDKIQITILILFIALQTVCLSLVTNKMISQIVDLVAL